MQICWIGSFGSSYLSTMLLPETCFASVNWCSPSAEMPASACQQVFSLGERGNILLHLEGAALIPHIVQAEGKRFPGEVSTCSFFSTQVNFCMALALPVISWQSPACDFSSTEDLATLLPMWIVALS